VFITFCQTELSGASLMCVFRVEVGKVSRFRVPNVYTLQTSPCVAKFDFLAVRLPYELS
jgi:hypothetical protein